MAKDFSNWVTNHDWNGKCMANINSKLAYKICSNNFTPPRTAKILVILALSDTLLVENFITSQTSL